MAERSIEHPLSDIADYANGLLNPDTRQRLERHLWGCDECRQALKREREFAALVRQTVQIASQPQARRLAALRPPASVQRHTSGMRLYHSLAPVTAIALVVALGMILQIAGWSPFNRSNIPVFVATANPPTLTATATNAPTATISVLPTGQNDFTSDNTSFNLAQTNTTRGQPTFASENQVGIKDGLLLRYPGQIAGSPSPASTPAATQIP